MKTNCKPLTDILNLAKALGATSVTVIPSENGWVFYIRDQTACALCSATLVPAAFGDGYEAWAPFAIDLDFLRDAIAKKDEADISLDDVILSITAGKSKCRRRLFDIDTTPRTLPRVNLKNSVGILSDNLIDAASKKHFANAGGEFGLTIKLSEDSIEFSCSSESDSYSETYDTLISNLEEENEIQCGHFSTEYIIPVLKALPKGLPTVIALDSDFPMKITIQTELYKIDIFIAPLIIGD